MFFFKLIERTCMPKKDALQKTTNWKRFYGKNFSTSQNKKTSNSLRSATHFPSCLFQVEAHNFNSRFRKMQKSCVSTGHSLLSYMDLRTRDRTVYLIKAGIDNKRNTCLSTVKSDSLFRKSCWMRKKFSSNWSYQKRQNQKETIWVWNNITL